MPELEFKFLKNMNVLYVEDDSLVATQTIKLLKYFFNNIYYYDNAEEALTAFEKELIHLIITDIELPLMNGLDFCKKIREISQVIPIFVTTIHDDKENLLKAIKLNLTDYLIKPVSITSLQKTLVESYRKSTQSGTLKVKITNEIYYNLLLGHIETSNKSVPIHLSKTEIKLLNLLIQNNEQVVSRERIEHVLSADKSLSDASYKSLIFRLRKKIGKESITSLSGVGIKLNTKDS